MKLEDEVRDLGMVCVIKFKNFKDNLNFCRQQRDSGAFIKVENVEDDRNQIVPCQYGHQCDRMLLEIVVVAGLLTESISVLAEQLVNLHLTSGSPRFLSCLFHCFKDDQEKLIKIGLALIQLVVMKVTSVRKFLKKYDKVHESAIGMTSIFSKLQAAHFDIWQSPWLIELVACCINLNGSDSLISDDLLSPLSFELNLAGESAALTLILPGYENLDYNFICPICLDIVFQPYGLHCGHIFCKSCACLAADVLIIDGLKDVSRESKCPVCRESGMYDKSVCMSELGLLLQQRYKHEFNERLIEEREMILKQTKEYWALQTSLAMGL